MVDFRQSLSIRALSQKGFVFAQEKKKSLLEARSAIIIDELPFLLLY